MVKFVHKRYQHKTPPAKLVIYYSLSDIVLGILLVGLVAFFVVSYVRDHSIGVIAECLRQQPF
ncbi:MAG: hypothetical protein KGJ93_04455 [Patescibacteria group bacterium]|nr:hypothetical protein [Patescibacteria group bacterium]